MNVGTAKEQCYGQAMFHSAERWREVLKPIVERYKKRGIRLLFRAEPKKPSIWYHNFQYQAKSWEHPRRVVAKVEWHRGELFSRVGFVVTNLSAKPEGVVHFYNRRGTAEQWIKEGKYALNWTRLSCHRFVANQVRLHLFILAYNLGNFLRRLCLPKAISDWSLRSLQVKLIKMGGRIVRHARKIIFQLAEVAVPRDIFAAILKRITPLRLSPG
jgi:hypothetical protein